MLPFKAERILMNRNAAAECVEASGKPTARIATLSVCDYNDGERGRLSFNKRRIGEGRGNVNGFLR
jgi:hypothetical protein